PVSPGILLTGYGLPLLLGRMAFVIPGGVGVIEGTMVALYDSLGIPDPVTVVVVLAYRILSFWLPLLLGFPLVGILQRKTEN
ncbi:MAG: flippase-like domain-containing protein, partial [Chloroflexi bacterium]|nr:flippase-like domain-containing protein [Chloroflexota bacterium]